MYQLYFIQISTKTDSSLHLGNSCNYNLTPHFFSKIFVRYTPLPSSKKSYATSARRNRHQQRNSRGPLSKILQITQTRQFVLHQIISPKTSEDVCPMCPISLVMNITTMLKVRKMLNYIRYTMFAIFANMLNYVRKCSIIDVWQDPSYFSAYQPKRSTRLSFY